MLDIGFADSDTRIWNLKKQPALLGVYFQDNFAAVGEFYRVAYNICQNIMNMLKKNTKTLEVL